jgi:Glycosyltransferase family 87
MSNKRSLAGNSRTEADAALHQHANRDDPGFFHRMIARRNVETWAVVLGSLLAGAAYAWFVGEDISWDWRNYHEYGAFALVNGRFDQDVAPGGFQTFLNPLAYVPAYLLRHHVAAPYWGMLLGALHGLNLALIYWLSRTVLGRAANGWTLAASMVIAAFGPMTLSEVGTSLADLLTALPVIAGIGLMLSANAQHRSRLVVAGVLIGAAVGLKLTNMAFFLAAAISLLYAARPMVALCCFAVGGALGALGTGGAWAWTLWQEFGNPVFPFYNAIFHSPEAAYESFADLRFMPHSVWEAFAYPFYWAIGNHRSSEWPFRDPRFAIAFVLLAASVITGLLYRLPMFARRDKQLLLVFLVAYVLWLREFSIHRYAVVLELLCAPVIVLLFWRLSGAMPHKPLESSRRVWASYATAGLAVAIALWSQPADWLRRPWSDSYQPQLPQELSDAATYLMIEKPLGYVVPLLGSGSRAYQLSDILMPIVPGGSLDHRIRAGLADARPGGVWALHLRGSPLRRCLLDDFGWEIDSSRACAVISGADGRDVEACRLQPSVQAKSPAGTC